MAYVYICIHIITIGSVILSNRSVDTNSYSETLEKSKKILFCRTFRTDRIEFRVCIKFESFTVLKLINL